MSNRTQSIQTDRLRTASVGLSSLAFARMTCTVKVLTIGILLLCAPVNSFAISTSPAALSFSGTAGTANPPAQAITLSKGNRTTNWTVRATTAWVSVTPSSGTIATEQDQVAVSVNLSGLSAGSYSSNVIISTESNSKRAVETIIPIALTVAAAPTATPVIGLSLTSLTYAGTAGGTNPTNQSFTISNTGSGTLTWTAGDSAGWLTLSPAAGTNTGTVTASVNLSGLAAGTYSGTITVAATGATSKTLPVSLTVSPGKTTISSATLSWNANTETDLAGYKIYVGTQSGTYGAPIVLGIANTYQITDLTVGTTYFFSITAYDKAGNESPHSSEASKSSY